MNLHKFSKQSQNHKISSLEKWKYAFSQTRGSKQSIKTLLEILQPESSHLLKIQNSRAIQEPHWKTGVFKIFFKHQKKF